MPGPYDDDDVEDVYGIFSGGGSDAGVAEADDDPYGIFKTPSKLASSEPMGPPAPPKEWWQDIIDSASDTVGTEQGRAGAWRAALQGASQNTADNLTRWASPSFADSLDQAGKDNPTMHGIGQAAPGVVAAMLGPPGIIAQGAIQGTLSGLSAAADGEGLWPGRGADGRPQTGVAGAFAGGALMGAGGTMLGNAIGKGARLVGETAPVKWAGQQLGRLWPAAADDAAAAAGRAAAPRALTPEAAESSAEFLARERAEIDGLLRKPPAPAPSPEIGEDEQALMDLLYRRRPPAPEPSIPPPPPPAPRAPYPPAPSAPPPPPTPDTSGEAVTQLLRGPSRAARGEGGRFAPRPYETPGEKLLRADGPHAQEGVERVASLSEPPLPIDGPPPPPFTDPMKRTFTAPAPRPPEPLPLGEPYVPPAPPERYVSPGERLLRVGEPLPTPRVGEPLRLPYEAPGSVPKMPPLRPSEAYTAAATRRAAGAPAPPRTMFHDLHDALKISPTYRKAAGAVKLADHALNAVGGKDRGLPAQLGRAAVEVAHETGWPNVLDQKVNAQDYSAPTQEERAPVADAPTLHYALQATLASGRAGLSPEDERALTEAVIQGDQSAISATDFRLRQRYPAYARAVERELRSYTEED